MPNESASHRGDDSHSDVLPTPLEVHEDTPFPFKFKAPSGRVHRLQVVASAGMAELVDNVTAKLGGEVEALGGEAVVEDGKLGKSGYALSYMDNEGDTVSITTDQDLVDAIALARKGHRDKVDLFVHDPSQPPISATLDPRPNLGRPITPPDSSVKDVNPDIQDVEAEDEAPVKRSRERKQGFAPSKEEQFVSGVPNDLLLPGAIAALAVVIVAVFAFSRTSNK